MRLVVWNVNRFSINTINDTSGANFAEKLASIAQSVWNNGFLRAIASTADIFVLIEVQSGRNVLGSLITGSGEQGVLFLLGWLKQNYNANWCVVPPLKLAGLNDAGEAANYTEGIAVFFRNDRVNFTGPYVWPTVGNVAKPPGPSVTAGPYPQPWNNALPANNYFAGQFDFTLAPNSRGNQTYITGNYRRPFFTTFTEVGTNRVIKLMSVHPSPNATKTAVVNTLPDISVLQPAGAAVVVVTGDFNINVKQPPFDINAIARGKRQKKTEGREGYFSLTQAGFSQKFNTNSPGTAGVTTVKRIEEGTPTSYLGDLGIDNVFVRYDGGLVAPGPANPLIINPVTGTAPYNSSMLLSLAQINQYYNGADAQTTAFRDVVNYGHIAHYKGTSDHLPIVVDI